MRPRFTVLMPVKDRAHLVRFAISSIIDQTFKDWELLIVDDGSMDNTWQIIREAERMKNIRGIRLKRHMGLVEALNIGNKEAKGEIIVKQDSDDVSLPNRLEVIDREIKDSEFFYHGMYQIWQGEPGDRIRRAYIPALPIERERILKEQYIPGAFCYTKSFIEKTPYRKSHCSEDWMLILDAYLRGHKIGFVNEGLYEYALQVDSNSLLNEGIGSYEEDEAAMRNILDQEYGIKGFKYATRK